MSKHQSLSLSPPLGSLTQQELSAYLYQTIKANIPYYSALARYRDRKRKLVIYADRWRYKNEKAFCRLTEAGLRLLKTGHSKKPKNPV